MRRTRKRSRRRRRRQRGGYLDALKAGVANGLAAVGLKKKQEDDSIQTSADLSLPACLDCGRLRLRRSRRRKSRRRKSRKTRRRHRTRRRRR